MKLEFQQIETTIERLSKESSAAEGGSQTQQAQSEPSFTIAVESFTASKHRDTPPSLPKLKSARISSHRHGANPALAMNLLQDIEKIVAGWQQELQQVLRQIQDLYLEGPIVDGWLESHARKPEEGVASLRKAEKDRLMDYVEEISAQNISYQSPRAGYQLCGLNADGQLWSQPCPTDQVPSVSVAIIRYQKLQQLLKRKQTLETRLSQLAETLTIMHSSLSA